MSAKYKGAKSPAVRRILQELKLMLKKPNELFTAHPLDDELFEWHFTIAGPPGTAFEVRRCPLVTSLRSCRAVRAERTRAKFWAQLASSLGARVGAARERHDCARPSANHFRARVCFPHRAAGITGASFCRRSIR